MTGCSRALRVVTLLAGSLFTSALAAMADSSLVTIDDETQYSFVTPAGPIGSTQTKMVKRVFAGEIVSLTLTIVSGTADDIGYVGSQPVTPALPECAGAASVQTPGMDVTDQVTIQGNVASFQLIAKENCCCLTGWGHETEAGRGDAVFRWHVTIAPFFQVLNPNPGLLNADGTLNQDTNALATGGTLVEGAVADGVTVVLLRARVAVSGTVEFSIPNWMGEEDGGLSTNGASRTQSLEVVTQQVGQGQDYYAFAYYLVPEDFNPLFGPYEELSERPILFQAAFTPDQPSASPQMATLALTLQRAPVVLVHGIFSSAATWTFGLVDDLRFNVTPADYSGTSGAPFGSNSTVVRRTIDEALAKLTSNNIAATQADVVTHSMGGILSRLYIGSPEYMRTANLFAGDVHKLMPLNAPFAGTPLANAAVVLRSTPNLFSQVINTIATFYGHPPDAGAVDNLTNCSPAIQQIPPTGVPSHVFAGTGVSPGLQSLDAFLARYLGLSSLFGEASDGVVGLSSQIDGATNGDLFSDVASNHLGVTSNEEYSNAVIALLNTPPSDGSSFGGIAAPDCPAGAVDVGTPLSRLAPHGQSSTSALEVSGALRVFVPLGMIPSGAQVFVTVEPLNGFVPTQLFLASQGTFQPQPLQPEGGLFSCTFTVPQEAVGNLNVVALGLDANGVDAVSAPATLTVQPQANLLSVRLTDRPAYFSGTSVTRQFGLLGFYDDGIVRDLTDPSTGTQFTSIDPTILTVSASGLATSVGVGSTALYASNNNVADTSEIVVLPTGGPTSNPGPGETVACTSAAGAQVQLDGSGSSDPAGLPLSFLWTGPFGQASGEVVSVKLPIGSNTVTLTVSDGQGGTASASTVIVVAALTSPAIGQISAQPSSLWPPNHKMVPVTVSVNATDACDATPNCTITSVTANEPITGDFAITGPLAVDLRATRLGSGSGRIYTLGVTCVDAFANSAASSVNVIVPHDQGN
jgi:pimeloyl-ACP methyl ester carboxylesterase